MLESNGPHLLQQAFKIWITKIKIKAKILILNQCESIMLHVNKSLLKLNATLCRHKGAWIRMQDQGCGILWYYPMVNFEFLTLELDAQATSVLWLEMWLQLVGIPV